MKRKTLISQVVWLTSTNCVDKKPFAIIADKKHEEGILPNKP
ncbi:MAG: hypothetical protein ACRD47_03400 [Nitrososphaeraceae archaeon]|jgi:hypothetical protein